MVVIWNNANSTFYSTLDSEEISDISTLTLHNSASDSAPTREQIIPDSVGSPASTIRNSPLDPLLNNIGILDIPNSNLNNYVTDSDKDTNKQKIDRQLSIPRSTSYRRVSTDNTGYNRQQLVDEEEGSRSDSADEEEGSRSCSADGKEGSRSCSADGEENSRYSSTDKEVDERYNSASENEDDRQNWNDEEDNRSQLSTIEEDSNSISFSDIDDNESRSSSEQSTNDTRDDYQVEAQLQREISASNEPEVDLAEELCNHLFQFNGCHSDEHLEQDRQHSESESAPNRERHFNLNRYARQLMQSNIPMVMDKPDFISKAQRESSPIPDWSKCFDGYDVDSLADREGVTSDEESIQDEHAPYICVSCSQSKAGSSVIRFDIDSFLGFTHSLAVACQGIDINLFPRFHTNIRTDLHLYTKVFYDFGKGEKAIRVKLQKVPHYCLGRILGHEDISLYIFFPRMYEPDKPTNFPGKGSGQPHHLLQVWTDSILLPSIFRYIPPTSRQHLPHSWNHARMKAQAYHTERSTHTNTDKMEDQVLSLHYSLHPQSLAPIWQEIEQRLTEPEYTIYHGAKLFFSSKNTKLRFSYSTLSEVWEAFERSLTTTLNLRYIDRNDIWLDLGKEITAVDYTLYHQRANRNPPPTTYLLKTCCLESYSRWAKHGEPGRCIVPTLYPSAMLRDVSNLTLDMSPSSRHRREGWVYSQVYNSFKELFDAAQTKPFSNPYLRQLAWDSKVKQMIQQQGRARLVADSALRKSYLASKTRVNRSIIEGQWLAYGVREENRVTFAFMDRIRISAENTGNWAQVHDVTPHNSQHIYSLHTINYLRYLLQNTNKFAAAFEWILSLGVKTRVDYEQCKLMTMVLQALPFAFDSAPIMRQNDLWKETFQRRRGGPEVLGMGLQATRAKFGYMWLNPRIDWKSMVFRSQFTNQMAFSSSMLRTNYQKNFLQVGEAKDDYMRIEAAGRWLEQYGTDEDCWYIITEFIYLTIIRAFRKEVWNHFKSGFREGCYKEATQGTIPLCWTEMERLLTAESMENLYLVDTGRTTIRSIKALVSLIWDFSNSQKDDHPQWDNIPFRILFRRASELLEQGHGADTAKGFREQFKRYFIATNWVMPYPRYGKFFQKNQEKRTIMIGVYHRRLINSPVRNQRGVKHDVRWLWDLTEEKPQIYRPKYPEQGENGLEWMPDWRLCKDWTGPILRCVPEEPTESFRAAGLELEKVREVIAEIWELNHPQVED
jgi:hypothetical protein